MRISLVASGAVTLLLAIVTLYNGTTVINAPTDNLILLGAAWRMLLGQVQHIDFYNPIGVLTYSLVEAGMSIGGANAGALPIACVLFLVVAAIWAACIAFQRFSPPIAGAFVVWVALMCVATRPLGYDADNHSYAMLYNRFGWVALGLLALQALIPPTRLPPILPARLSPQLEAISLGLLLAIIAYIKLNFAAFAVLAICLALVYRAELRSLQAVSCGVAAGLAFCLGLWLAVGVDPFHYLADLNSAVQSQSVGDRMLRLRGSIKYALPPLGLMFVAWLLLMWRRWEMSGGIHQRDIVLTVKVSFLCAAALLIGAGNTGESREIPLLAVAGLVFLALADFPSMGKSYLAFRAALGAAIVIPAVLIASRDLASIADTTMWRGYRVAGVEQGQRFDAPPLRDFVIPTASRHITQYWPAREIPQRLNDGFALLRKHVASDSRVFTVALTDEFSFALGLVPARGGPLWWDRYLSYSPKAPPPASTVFGEVTLIMVPIVDSSAEGCCRDPLEDIPVMYADYLDASFTQIDQSRYWRLLARKSHFQAHKTVH
jgi:hypothetical protein